MRADRLLRHLRRPFGWLQTLPWLFMAVYCWYRATFAETPGRITSWTLLQHIALGGFLLSAIRPLASLILWHFTRRRPFEATQYEDPNHPEFRG